MEHEKKELREAWRLGVEQAEDLDIYRFLGKEKACGFWVKEYDEGDKWAVEDAIENNPYSDAVLSRKYWQGYLAEVEKKGCLDYLIEEVHELAGEYLDPDDTIERLSTIIPFPFGSKLYTVFLNGYFHFTEAAQESRFDRMGEIGEDWSDDALIDAFVDTLEADWRNHFFEKMRSSKDVTPPARLYRFRKLGTEEEVSRVKDIILGNELWFSKVSQLNDLFEFKLMAKNDLPAPSNVGIVNFWDAATHQLDRVWVPKDDSSELREEMMGLIMKSESLEQGFKKAWKVVTNKVETKLTQIRDELGVCCFAGNIENRVLWAYYGGESQGVALGFSPTSPFWSSLRRVQYAKKPPVFSNALVRLDDTMARAIITKHKDWSIEDEWRLIGQPSEKSDQTSTGQTRSDSRHIYPPNDLVEVVFGPLTTDRNKRAILEACAMASLTPKFFEVCQTTGYKLAIRKCALQKKKDRTS